MKSHKMAISGSYSNYFKRIHFFAPKLYPQMSGSIDFTQFAIDATISLCGIEAPMTRLQLTQ